MSLTEAQIEALADGAPEDAAKILAETSNVVEMKAAPPPDLTESEKQEADEKKADQDVKDIPFTPEAIAAFAKTRFDTKIEWFKQNTERQIRDHAARGADSLELRTVGAVNYHNAVQSYLLALGFNVTSMDDGKPTSALRVVLY